MHFWIAHILILGAIIFFMSGEEEVNWQTLCWVVFLTVVPGGLLTFILFGDSILRAFAFYGMLFVGLAFMMKIQINRAAMITGAFYIYMMFFSVLIK